MTNLEIFAGILYERYSAAVGGVAFNGVPLPSWEEFLADPMKNRQSAAWIEVAKTAKEFFSFESHSDE